MSEEKRKVTAIHEVRVDKTKKGIKTPGSSFSTEHHAELVAKGACVYADEPVKEIDPGSSDDQSKGDDPSKGDDQSKGDDPSKDDDQSKGAEGTGNQLPLN